ncbi:MAG: hypothetical protein KAJ75_06895 [Alphaproteobacteria bacterium]|nr:hypothetical protein [Alphaproteobacteria bacterium]
MTHLTTKTAIKKARAVELWRTEFGNITKLCAAIPIARKTFYRWLKADKKFSRAIVDAEAELNDDIRSALIDKAAGGDLGAIIFYLKKRHPEFADQPYLLQQFNIGGRKDKTDIEFIVDEEPKGGDEDAE